MNSCEAVPLSSWRRPCRWAASPIQPDAAARSSSAPAGPLLPVGLPGQTEDSDVSRFCLIWHILSPTYKLRTKTTTWTPNCLKLLSWINASDTIIVHRPPPPPSVPSGFCSSSSGTWRHRWQGRTGWGSGRSRVPLQGAVRLSGASPGSRSRNRWVIHTRGGFRSGRTASHRLMFPIQHYGMVTPHNKIWNLTQLNVEVKRHFW